MARRKYDPLPGWDEVRDRKKGAMYARLGLKTTREAKRAAQAGNCGDAISMLNATKYHVTMLRKTPRVADRTVSRLERLYRRAALKVREYCPR